jgi:hypothetical protein
VVSINAPASSVDADLALVPKGAGALSADVADSGYGGNKRGAFATDWMHTYNGVRSSGIQVAAGGYATLGGGGYNQAGTTAHTDVSIPGGYSHTVTANTGTIGGGYFNTLTGAGATARGGERHVISGQNATVMGGYTNTASAKDATVPGGKYASASLIGKYAYTAGPIYFSNAGQFCLHILRGATTSASPVTLTADASPQSALNHTVLVNAQVFGFELDVICNSAEIGTSATDYGLYGAQWTITGLVRRASGVGSTTIIGTPYVTANADASLAAVTVSVTAETATYGSLQVTVGGLASTNMHWVATIQTTEVS